MPRANTAIMTEAKRLVRNLIKREIKRQGGNVSHYIASDLTKAVEEFLAHPKEGKKMIAAAKGNITRRAKAYRPAGA